MTDVRLTALNPVDSQVYPVACNTSGELLVADDGVDYLPLTGGDLTGPLTSTSSITAGGNIETGSASSGKYASLKSDGRATFIKAEDSHYLWLNTYDGDGVIVVNDINSSTASSANLVITNDGSITAAGTATFAGVTGTTGTFSGRMNVTNLASVGDLVFQAKNENADTSRASSLQYSNAGKLILNGNSSNSTTVSIDGTNGTATFAGNVTAPNITSLNTLVEELQTKMSLILRQIDISAETP
jgi:hypothetical protein